MSTLHIVQEGTGLAISTDELRDRLGGPALTVVDVRPLAAYNGWRLRDEARGGHIPGAVAFPGDWLRTVDAPEVERLLRSKGVEPGNATAPGMCPPRASSRRRQPLYAASGRTSTIVSTGSPSRWRSSSVEMARPVPSWTI